MRGLQRIRVCLSDLLDLCIMKFSMGHNSSGCCHLMHARQKIYCSMVFGSCVEASSSVNEFCLGDVRIVTSNILDFLPCVFVDPSHVIVERRHWFRSKRSYDGKCLTDVVVLLRPSRSSIVTRGGVVHVAHTPENVSHVSGGFDYHIAARVTLDRILLSVCYVLTQFHDHVVFDWTWIHADEMILFIPF